ncbi:MAG: iron uptake system protein EfeO [Moraxella sp.]|nr:iron uptake system protein EfeO [Moraxella sp.]
MSVFKPLALVVAMAALVACQKPAEEQTKQEVASVVEAAASAVQAASEAQAVAVDLSAETAEYKTWVEGQIDQLLTESEKFVALLAAGKLDEAKALYPKARMYFERSEPVAEIFGDLDPRIDNREADLEQGEKWTGFHAIEKILWTQNTTEGTKELADQLIADIKELRAKIPTAEVTGELMISGSVDLLNEVSTTKITGEEEIFSKTDLYDFKANIEGAQKIFEILTPKLQAKDPALVKTLEERFKAVHDLLDSHKKGDEFKFYNELSADDTKALAEAVNKLGEPLAQMGVLLK